MKKWFKRISAVIGIAVALVATWFDECVNFIKGTENTIVVIDENDGRKLDNLTYGIPKADIVLNRVGFATGYSDTKHQPLWVSYILTDNEVTNRVVERMGFQRDEFMGRVTPTPSDYLNTGYDRGHIAPAADMAWSERSMKNSFYMSNMCPQTPMFNRGIWKRVEEWVREMAITNKSLAVYSGPIFTMRDDRVCIGTTCDVEVPIAFYKVIMIDNPNNRSMIAFVLNNESSSSNLIHYVRTVDYVEDLTGLDFFSSLNDKIENDLESKVETNKWSLLEGFYSPRRGGILSKTKKVKK